MSFKTNLVAVLLWRGFVLPADAADKPNIVVIWGDYTGLTNSSAGGQGVVGYRTPNIDRIADEGALFADYYTESSCTAGLAA